MQKKPGGELGSNGLPPSACSDGELWLSTSTKDGEQLPADLFSSREKSFSTYTKTDQQDPHDDTPRTHAAHNRVKPHRARRRTHSHITRKCRPSQAVLEAMSDAERDALEAAKIDLDVGE